MEYLYYKDVQGFWRWRLLADNNKAIAVAGEGYNNKKDCLHAIDLVKQSSSAPATEAS